ncbi:MAG: hypothetical protein LBU64_06695 [Planctomycetota bacterium]|jgi:hypothetical protein|nr:hypothetical protein [Planctomycetota bacterium]
MSGNILFSHVNPELYRHPDERKAKARLDKIPGFARGAAKLAELAGGPAERRGVIASLARVGPGVYPRLHDLWNETLERFGLGSSPLYVSFAREQSWSLQDWGGLPALILDSDWLDLLTRDEMGVFLAMRAGDIRLGNARYLAAADYLRRLRDFSGLAAIPAFMWSWGLENWRRAAMFSADRAAALSLGDGERVAAFLAKLSGAGSLAWGSLSDPEALRLQGLEAISLEQDWSNHLARRFAMVMNRRRGGFLARRLDLLAWFAEGVPQKVLSGELREFVPDPSPAGEDERIDSGPAFWGAFAGAPGGDAAAEPGRSRPDLAGAIEKGWETFRQVGESLWHSLDSGGKDKP